MIRGSLLAMCALAPMAVGCSSSDSVGTGVPSGPSDASASSDVAVGAATDGGAFDAGAAMDASPPPAPSCASGDRSEFAGTIPGTLVTVAVCSTCGKSYVVAANDGADAASVTVDNGTSTVTANMPARGTVTTAPIADNPADGTVSVCDTSGSHGCLAVAPMNQRYCDPYRSVTSLRAERIDQGVDYGGAGPLYAIGPGTIDFYESRTDTGWPGGTFVAYKLSAGPGAGKVVYLAENIDLNPALKSGSFVYNGTVLGTLVNASPDSEIGWGVAGQGIAAEHSCYTEGCDTPLGDNFNELLVCLGTPTGLAGKAGCCPASAGWPSGWCALLAAWQ